MTTANLFSRNIARTTTYAITGIAVFCLLTLTLSLGCSKQATSPSDEATRLRGSCQNNLKQLGLVIKMYASESKGSQYPPLSSESGKLMFEAKNVVPEYMSDMDIINCPAIDNKKSEINDESYVYLGYVLRNETDVERFAQYYREHTAKGGPFDELIPTTETDPELPLLKGIPFLKEGVERLYIKDINIPSASAMMQSSIPIIIEWPDHHRNPQGGSILYMDGHVEYCEYPGKWPMTEKTMKILCELAGRPPIGK